MRLIIFISSFFLFLSGVSAQTAKPAKINFRSASLAKISVSKGKAHLTIDLSKEVAGCAYVSGASKRELDKRDCAAPSASFKLLDSTEKNRQTFLLVMSEAMGNCNVCGQCGASEAFALVWLKLDARLRLIEKKSVPIEFCFENVSLVNPSIAVDEQDQNEDLKLVFNQNVLTVEFEKVVNGKNEEIIYEFSRLTYDRKTPENGFFIKTERRKDSSNKEQ